MMDASLEAEARSDPSGEKAQPLTDLVWPRRVRRQTPEFMFQTLAVLSPELVARSEPSGEKAQHRTWLVWPFRVRRQASVAPARVAISSFPTCCDRKELEEIKKKKHKYFFFLERKKNKERRKEGKKERRKEGIEVLVCSVGPALTARRLFQRLFRQGKECFFGARIRSRCDKKQSFFGPQARDQHRTNDVKRAVTFVFRQQHSKAQCKTSTRPEKPPRK